MKEGRDEALLGLRKRVAATEESINDLKFVISQKEIKLRDLEEEVSTYFSPALTEIESGSQGETAGIPSEN